MRNRSIFLLFVAALAVVGTASRCQAEIVAFWQFNEKMPGEVADGTPGAILDSSGNGHHGTAVGQEMQGDPPVLVSTLPTYVEPCPGFLPAPGAGVWWLPPGGYFGGDAPSAMRFKGGKYQEWGNTSPPENVQDRVEVPADAAWDLRCGSGQDYTFEALVKVDPDPYGDDPEYGWWSGGEIMSCLDRSDPGHYTSGWDWDIMPTPIGLMRFAVGNGPYRWQAAVSSGLVTAGEWHHLAVVLDSTGGGNVNVRFYIDYALSGTDSFTGVGDMNLAVGGDYDGLWIGDLAGGPYDQFAGDVDAIRISDRALTPREFFPRVVPEPSIAVLLVMGGLMGLAAWRRVL